MSRKTIRVISLGAGLQSSALYRMNALGMLGEVSVAAIFADTGDEPAWTHRTLSLLEKDHGEVIPIRKVSVGVLSEDWFSGAKSRKKGKDELAMGAAMPVFLKNPDGSTGMSPSRSCTSRYKVSPLREAQKKLMAEYGADHVEVLIGISLDEATRMRHSADKWSTNRYPLIFDVPMRRGEIARWHEKNDFPIPQRSSCVQCPFHSDAEWRQIREHPTEWEKAVLIDRRLREEDRFVSENADASKAQYRGVPFLHRSCQPLSEVDFDEDSDQLDLFQGECTGLCGV